MKKLFLAFILLPILTFASSSPCLPSSGCTGVSNNNSNTLTLGGAVDITGAFSGVPANDSTVVHNSGVETINGTKTFTSPINGSITGTASGAPPTGLAGGVLAGTFPNPTLASVITAGSAGSTSVIPGLAWNAAGQLTAVTPYTVTPAAIGAPTTSGTGATGTWGINISGNASTATSATPSGAAGGDLLGSNFPNPIVASIGGKSVTLGGAFSTQGILSLLGVYNLSATLTGNTAVTFPIGGTLLSDAGSYSNPAWLTALDASKITTGILPAARLSGTYPNAISGGTESVQTLSTTGNATFYPLLVNANSAGSQLPFTGPLGYNPSTNTLTAATFVGNLNGNATTASGAPPTGLAGGVLAGTFPNPTLASVITAGSAGSTSVIPGLAWNAAGQLTAVTPYTVTPAAIGAPTTSGTGATGTWGINISGNASTATSATPSGAAGGDLINNFPSPTVAKINGSLLGITTPTSGNILVGSGLAWVSQTLSGDASISSTGTFTLDTVNSSPGTYGSASAIPVITVNNKGLAPIITTVPTSGAVIGTANQVLVNGTTGSSQTGTITLTTPQNIATTSTPTFAGETITGSALTGITPAFQFANALAAGEYLNIGTNGRAIGVATGGNLFETYNLDYNQTTSNYQYATSSPAGLIQLLTTGGGALQYAPSGTAGASVTPSTALSWNSSGVINIPNLGANSIVTTDASSNQVGSNSATSFTPTIGDGTHNFTTSVATGADFKFGHMHNVSVSLTWTAKGSATAGSNLVVSLNTAKGASCPVAGVSFASVSGLSFTGATLTGGVSGNLVYLFGSGITGTQTPVTVSQAANAGIMQFSTTYWDN